MPKREARPKRVAEGPAGKVELGFDAIENYKARLTKGLLGVGLGEGPIVEILNYRTKKVLRRELFDDDAAARVELKRIREDIKKLSTEEFRRKYLTPPS
jgi:hypothetical protein